MVAVVQTFSVPIRASRAMNTYVVNSVCCHTTKDACNVSAKILMMMLMIVAVEKYFMGETGRQLSFTTSAIAVVRFCKQACEEIGCKRLCFLSLPEN